MTTNASRHLCIITEGGGWGGAATHTVALIETLLRRGFGVNLVTVGQPVYDQVSFSDEARIERTHWVDRRRWGTSAWRRLLGPIPRQACIFVKGAFLAGSLSLDLALRSHFRTLLAIEHSIPPPRPGISWGRYALGLLPGIGLRWYLAYPYLALRSRLMPHAVCVSDAGRRGITRVFWANPRTTYVVHNGIDTDAFARCQESRSRIRAELGLPPEANLFAGVGRLDRVKGYDLAIRALSGLLQARPACNIHLMIVGEGSERAPLERLAKQAGCRDRVYFVGRTDRPRDYYSASDFFLMPSRQEGLPLALLEAMACECVPIATPVGGIPEVITDDSLGWLVPPDDPAALAAAMRRAVDMPADTLAAMRSAVRARVVSAFQALAAFERLADTIEEICAPALV